MNAPWEQPQRTETPSGSTPLGQDVPAPTIPDHQLLHRIGGGSYGEVWLTRNALGAYRAAKIIYRKSFEDSRPFEREFKGLLKFEPISRSHEGLVDILQVGRQDDYFYYVMELADGEEMQNEECKMKNRGVANPTASDRQQSILNYRPKTLRALIRPDPQPSTLPSSVAALRRVDNPQPGKGRLSVNECVQIGLALTSALAHLHKHGLVHRDIKPSNIIFVQGAPKLADIGLVTDADTTLSYVGTEGYIPPEGPGAAQADIFSLGKVLYEMATGQDRRQFPDLPPNLKDWPDQAGVLELNEVILKACESDPRRRYASATSMREDLALLQRGQSVKRQYLIRERVHAVRKIGLAAAAVVLVAAASVFLWQTIRRNNAPVILADTPYGNISTTVSEAAVACRRGCDGLRKGTAEGFNEASEAFTAATNADPQCVFAHARLFETYLMSEDYDVNFINSKTERLGTLATNLWKLSPTNAETHAALAIVNFLNKWEWDKAKDEFEQALRADRNCRMALVYYGYMLTRQRRAGEARKVLERADELDPHSPLITKFLGHCEYVQRHYQPALTLYRSASGLDKRYPGSHYWQARALWALGESLAAPDKIEYQGALDEFELHDEIQGAERWETRTKYRIRHEILKKDGILAYWQERLRLVDPIKEQMPYWYAECHARAGHRAEALDGLTVALEQRDTMENLLVDEFWDRYRDDKAFKAILHRVGLDR